MRTSLALAVLMLSIIEALLLPRTVKDLRVMRQMRAQAASEALLPTSIGPFAGYDTEGLPLTLITKDTKLIVPVVLHSAQLPSDLAYVSRLKEAVGSREIAIIAVCDSGRCDDGLPSGHPAVGFSIMAYGSYVALMEMAHYDQLNQIMLLNERWSLKQTLHRPPSAEELAAEIQKAVGK